MRIGAQWIYSKEGWDDVSDTPDVARHRISSRPKAAALVLLVSLIVGGIGVRRLRDGRGAGLLRATMILSLVLLTAYIATVWAMAGKPD